MRATNTEFAARASLLVLHVQPAPRQVCLAEGSDILDNSDGLTRILDILRSYLAPGPADAIRHQVTRFTNCRRSAQSVGEYIAEYDLLRRKAESKMEVGAGSPGQLSSILCVNNAGLSRHEQSLVMASCRKSLTSEDALANMRRLFGLRDDLSEHATAYAVGSLAGDEAADAPAAYRKAKEQGAGKKKKDGLHTRGGDTAKGGGQKLNGFNRKTGLGSRRFRRDSEYQLAPRCPWRDTPWRDPTGALYGSYTILLFDFSGDPCLGPESGRY